LRYQPSAMLAGDVSPEPAPGDGGTASRSNKEEDVRNAPEPPGDESLELEAPHIDHSGASADGRKIALMLVTEWHRWGLSFNAAFDDLRNIGTLLLGGRGNTRNRLAVRSLDPCGITNDEDILMARYIEVG